MEQIASLPWSKLDKEGMLSLMVLSAYSAKEFAESLRIALDEFPYNPNLQKMAKGELGTDNLQFNGYTRHGDHADFLWDVIEKEKLKKKVSPKVFIVGEKYLQEVKKLPKELRAMSIFSREKILPTIYRNILKNKNWKEPALQAYQYYIKRHIELDAGKGGHGDSTAELPVTDEVEKFYSMRLNMYKNLF